jgi:hypothetical protein
MKYSVALPKPGRGKGFLVIETLSGRTTLPCLEAIVAFEVSEEWAGACSGLKANQFRVYAEYANKRIELVPMKV